MSVAVLKSTEQLLLCVRHLCSTYISYPGSSFLSYSVKLMRQRALKVRHLYAHLFRRYRKKMRGETRRRILMSSTVVTRYDSPVKKVPISLFGIKVSRPAR